MECRCRDDAHHRIRGNRAVSVVTANHSNVGGYKARTLGASVQTGSQPGSLDPLAVTGTGACVVGTYIDASTATRYAVYRFVATGTVASRSGTVTADWCAVAGGGGGGSQYFTGAGGAGGYMAGTGVPIGTTATTIAIGGGGASGSSGTATTWDITLVSFTATISTTVLNVSAVASGTFAIGQLIVGSGVGALTRITSFGTGTGGTGTYNLSVSSTVSSGTSMTAQVSLVGGGVGGNNGAGGVLGGSGGGGGPNTNGGGAGTPGQGNAGGSGAWNGGSESRGGGGGGSSASGGTYSGGNGTSNTLTGVLMFLAGGGGSTGVNGWGGQHGQNGKGGAGNPSSITGDVNSGGGSAATGAGGSGTVIIRVAV